MFFFRRAFLYGGLSISLAIGSFAHVSARVLDGDMLEKIYVEHMANVPYKNIANDPFVIMFSCVPGMGKTFLSAELASRYQAICINNNEIRDYLKQISNLSGHENQQALKEYLFYMFERYDYPNKRMILDASIDRSYVHVFPYLATRAVPFFVIRLDYPRHLLIERITQEHGAQAYTYLQHLDRWFDQYETFGKIYKNYFLFNNLPGASLDSLHNALDSALGVHHDS